MANEYLTRIPTSSGNEKVWTLSAWIKTNDTSNTNYLFGYFDENASPIPRGSIQFNESNVAGKTTVGWNPTGNSWYQTQTKGDHRDPSNWLHLCIAVDTTKTDEGDGIRMYFNGAKESATPYLGTWGSGAAAINVDTGFNRANLEHYLNAFRVSGGYGKVEYSDFFWVDGQALTPDVFGFYKEGDGYVSAGSTLSTDFRPGQWVPKRPRIIKTEIERRGGFGVNGFYLPMNDSSNVGADFHCDPNSIITLKGEDLPQPRNGAPTTSDAYVSQLRQETGTLGFDGCVKFDGTGDYLSIPKTSFQMLHKLTSSWTVEGYVFKTADAQGTIFDTGGSSSATIGTAVYINTGGDLRLRVRQALSGAVVSQNFPGTVALNRWQHIAISYDGTSIRVFVEGKIIGTISYNTQSSTDSTQNFSIGVYDAGSGGGLGGYFTGFISNLRVIDGTALYTSNFTVPTEALTNVTNTTLLCCNSSTSATASIVTPGTITANGDVFATRNELTGSISLAVPGISTSTGINTVTNGHFDSNVNNWTAVDATLTWNAGRIQTNRTGGSGYTGYQAITVESGRRYTLSGVIDSTGTGNRQDIRILDNLASSGGSIILSVSGTDNEVVQNSGSFTASQTTYYVYFVSDNTGTGFFDNIVVKQEDAPRDYSADIKGSGSNKTVTALGSAGVGYELGGYYDSAVSTSGGANRLTFPAGSDFAYGTGDFTVEGWGYPTGGHDGAYAATYFYSQAVGGQNYFVINFGTDTGAATGDIAFTMGTGGAGGGGGCVISATGIVPRNQWSHIAVVRDGTTVTLYLNGVAVGTATGVTFDANDTTFVPTLGAYTHTSGSNFFYNGYIQDFRIYKGVAKYKGGFDVPKPYTPVGFEGDSWRTVADCTANNFATLNPVDNEGGVLSNGNLTQNDNGSSDWNNSRATIGASSGKWYWEMRVDQINQVICASVAGAAGTDPGGARLGQLPGQFDDAGVTYYDDGRLYHAGAQPSGQVSWGASYGATDIIGIALDMDDAGGKVWFAKNNSWQASGNPSTGANAARSNLKTYADTWFPISGTYFANTTQTFNFGQNPSFSGQVTAGTNTDSNGKGLFKYAPPSGFLALCEDNLPAPAIADPGEHFKSVLYTGDGNSGRSITGLGFQPDLVWTKERTSTSGHIWFDSVRGADKYLFSVLTNAEGDAGGGVISFDSDGYSTGSNGAVNQDGEDYVAWCWKAGGAAISNTDGSITSQVSANQTAGFSIVSYTGNATDNATVGHGLGKVPDMIIVKNRTSAVAWGVWHSSLTSGQVLRLNATTEAQTPATAYFQDENNTSSVFSLGTNDETNDGDGDTYIAYCWAEIEGFSKFGSYTGNGSTDGPFVYCGFKPAFVMIKAADDLSPYQAYASWAIKDSSRHPYNKANPLTLWANATYEEGKRGNGDADTFNENFDFLSNGFKMSSTNSYEVETNKSGEKYIFMAFAESPFKTANAK